LLVLNLERAALEGGVKEVLEAEGETL